LRRKGFYKRVEMLRVKGDFVRGVVAREGDSAKGRSPSLSKVPLNSFFILAVFYNLIARRLIGRHGKLNLVV
jgi:hypothetical protein